MKERQVLFRLEAPLLDRLDRRLLNKGYKTRNAWFREVVEQFLSEGRRKTVTPSEKTVNQE